MLPNTSSYANPLARFTHRKFPLLAEGEAFWMLGGAIAHTGGCKHGRIADSHPRRGEEYEMKKIVMMAVLGALLTSSSAFAYYSTVPADQGGQATATDSDSRHGDN